MNYSLNLNYTLENMQKYASQDIKEKIDEVVAIIKNIKPTSPYYPKNVSLIEFKDVSLFGLKGNITLFFIKNINGEIKEFSANFISTESVGRDILHNYIEFSAREFSEESLNHLRAGKKMLLASISHKTSRRAGRDPQALSRYTLSAKRENDGSFSVVPLIEENPSGCICTPTFCECESL